MQNNQFIHLHVHTEFSLVDGLVRIKPLVEKTAALNIPAVAVTDWSNLFGFVQFYRAAISRGVKPIAGTQIWLENENDERKPFALVLLCQNLKGYQNVTRLISRAYLEGQVLDKPVVKRAWLSEYVEGLIVLSGGVFGDIGQAVLANNLSLARDRLAFWLKLFDHRFYLELTRTGRAQEEAYIHEAVKLASEFDVPVVATNDVRFIEPDDFEAHEARVCIHDGYVLHDPKRPRIYSEEQYLRSPEEMIALFKDIPEAIENTVLIAKRCNFRLSLGENFLPNFPVPEGMNEADYLAALSKEGLEQRLAIIFGHDNDKIAQNRKAYDERLDLELGVINQMGFPGYFLIVADFIKWSKNNDVPVGPGRGSGAGSLVAYALGITDLDPLQYDLLFERFLNPERVSMPDFDIDFCMEGRDRVIDYVAGKYGRRSVSQIITYGTMAAKAVVRDVGRVLGLSYGFVDKIAKLIPFEIGITLDKALAQEELLRARYEQEEEVRTLVDLAKKLEGITRNAGKHAGGVVIAPSLLTDFTPLYCEPGGGNLVTQFDKNDVEAVGLVKFDFLGLRTLTIINWAVRAINERLKNEGKASIDISLIPTDDQASFDLLKLCQTTAVFQLESRGMKDLIKRLAPDCFEDIVALVALFRPGPLQSGMVDDFIDRKHGRAKVNYPHPDLAPILKPTYGVILYQEQVMQIAQVLANYSLGAADLLRRAMGKKKPEEMAKQRDIFLKGAIARGVDQETASYIFDLMEKFAGYGFNKSHSAAYALIAYQTAWLKAHYPAEFMAAVLSSDMDNTDKVVFMIEECRLVGLSVMPPHVNRSDYAFKVKEGALLYGLGAIKGAGSAAIENMLLEREQGGLFKDLFDFCRRVDLRKVNKRVLEALIKAGAMDGLGPNRAVMFESIKEAVRAAEQHMLNHSVGQNDLFGVHLEQTDEVATHFASCKPWTKRVLLENEKETLGLYFSGHPLDEYRAELLNMGLVPIFKLGIGLGASSVMKFGGMISGIRTMMTKRGDKMAFVRLADESASIELAVFSDVYAHSRELLQKDQLLIVEGEVGVDEFSGGLRASAKRVLTIDKAREMFGRYLLIELHGHEQDFEGKIDTLCGVLSQFPGALPICIDYFQHQAHALLPLGKDWGVLPKDDLLTALRKVFGEDKVRMVF